MSIQRLIGALFLAISLTKIIMAADSRPDVAQIINKAEASAILGEPAQRFDCGKESGFASRILILYVAKGNAFLTVGLAGFGDDAVALEKAKTVAQKLLEHL